MDIRMDAPQDQRKNLGINGGLNRHARMSPRRSWI